MINKLIEADSVPGEWYTSKRVSSMTRPTFVPTDPAVQVAKLRDDSGWGVDEEDVRGGKLGVAEGEAAPRDDDAPPAAAEKKPILGKHRRRYSNRL